MSLDIRIYSAVELRDLDTGEQWQENYERWEWSGMTHNMSRVARAAGAGAVWRPEESGIERAGDMIPILERALDVIYSDWDRFKQMDPPNGWGSLEGLVEMMSGYLEAARAYPRAYISVSR